MIEFIVITIFIVVIIREMRKKEKDPNYRSWMDDVKPWDAWRRHGH